MTKHNTNSKKEGVGNGVFAFLRTYITIITSKNCHVTHWLEIDYHVTI